MRSVSSVSKRFLGTVFLLLFAIGTATFGELIFSTGAAGAELLRENARRSWEGDNGVTSAAGERWNENMAQGWKCSQCQTSRVNSFARSRPCMDWCNSSSITIRKLQFGCYLCRNNLNRQTLLITSYIFLVSYSERTNGEQIWCGLKRSSLPHEHSA